MMKLEFTFLGRRMSRVRYWVVLVYISIGEEGAVRSIVRRVRVRSKGIVLIGILYSDISRGDIEFSGR